MRVLSGWIVFVLLIIGFCSSVSAQCGYSYYHVPTYGSYGYSNYRATPTYYHTAYPHHHGHYYTVSRPVYYSGCSPRPSYYSSRYSSCYGSSYYYRGGYSSYSNVYTGPHWGTSQNTVIKSPSDRVVVERPKDAPSEKPGVKDTAPQDLPNQELPPPKTPPGSAGNEGQVPPPPTPTEPKDVVATAGADPSLSQVYQAAEACGLLPEIRGAGPYTIFAPVNEAIEAIPDIWKYLKENPEEMKKVLYHHAASGQLTIADAQKSGKLTSLLGFDIQVTASGTNKEVNGAQVVEADIECTKGVIHKIDKVLLPPDFSVPETAPTEDPLPTPPKDGAKE